MKGLIGLDAGADGDRRSLLLLATRSTYSAGMTQRHEHRRSVLVKCHARVR